MKKKVLVGELALGMYVEELDRPWLDTPFLLQGFLVETDDQLHDLKHYCEFVYIDPTRSVGAEFSGAARQAAGAKHGPKVSRRETSATVQRVLRTAGGGPQTGKSSVLADIKTIFKETFVAGEPGGAGRPQPASTVGPASPSGGARKGGKAPHDGGGRERLPPSARTRDADAAAFESFVERKEKTGFLKHLRDVFRAPADAAESAKTAAPETAGVARGPHIIIYEDLVSVEEEMAQAEQLHRHSWELMEGIVQDLRRDRVLDAEKAQDAVTGMVDSIIRNPDALLLLTKLKDKDSYAYGHAIDVAIYVLAFGRHLGLPKDELNTLGMAGLLQDIGKMKLPSELLEKTGKLSAAEFDLIKTHVPQSVRILESSHGISPDIIEVVACHHERLDGSGYPKGLSGYSFGTFGNMAAIVDCFQALTSERPYAVAVPPYEALQMLYEWRGKYFRAALVEQFIQCIGIYPVGSLVELNTGEVGVVIGQNRVRRMKPRVMVILDPQKQPYKYPAAIDLVNDPKAFGDRPYAITRGLEYGMYDIDPKEYYL